MKKILIRTFFAIIAPLTLLFCGNEPTPALPTLPTVTVSTLTGGVNGLLNGTLANAAFNYPTGIVLDAIGNIYVSDNGNNSIRKITPDGNVSTLAGDFQGGYADGLGTNAKFEYIQGLTVDVNGNVYVADAGNSRIRKITPDGNVTTFSGSYRAFADGPRSNAWFNEPHGICMDNKGNIYVGDTYNNRIRKITPDGDVSTLAGSIQGYADGEGVNAQFYSPTAVTVDKRGNIYVCDTGNSKIRKITPEGFVTTLAGSTEGYADGFASSAKFFGLSGICIDLLDNLYLVDSFNDRIRKLTPGGNVSTFAGGAQGYLDGLDISARFYEPHGIVMDALGQIYVSDSRNNRIRKIVIQ